MFELLFDGSQVNLLVAFVAGFITFFASCLLPLVPTYLAYLSGVSLQSDEATSQRWSVFRVALFFVLGFITTFVILGLLLSQFSAAIVPYRVIINRLAGLLFIGLGLFMLGIFKSNFFSRELRFDVDHLFKRYKHTHAFLTGVAFGFGWTPCIGPVLAVILFWSVQQSSMLMGTLLLTVYGIGLGIPFLLVALGFEKIIPLLKKYARVSQFAMYLAGGVIILAGILMFSGQFQRLSLILLNLLGLDTLAV
jgi:cytochrome c-type biogenesis protein